MNNYLKDSMNFAAWTLLHSIRRKEQKKLRKKENKQKVQLQMTPASSFLKIDQHFSSITGCNSTLQVPCNTRPPSILLLSSIKGKRVPKKEEYKH